MAVTLGVMAAALVAAAAWQRVAHAIRRARRRREVQTLVWSVERRRWVAADDAPERRR